MSDDKQEGAPDLGRAAVPPAVTPQDTGAGCAWCGTALTDEDTFLLRVGARLCATCADEAGRIHAAQQQTDR